MFYFVGHFDAYLLKYLVLVVCTPLWSETMMAQTDRTEHKLNVPSDLQLTPS